MLNRIFNSLLLGITVLIIITVTVSCQKEKDTIGVILVKDSFDNPVSEARVVLHSNPIQGSLYDYADQIDDYYDRDLDELIEGEMEITPNAQGQTSDVFKADWTDDNGRAEFTFPLGMVLNVSVLKTSGNDEHLGAGAINIKKNETTTKIIRLVSY